jgi:hypothetical protein
MRLHESALAPRNRIEATRAAAIRPLLLIVYMMIITDGAKR